MVVFVWVYWRSFPAVWWIVCPCTHGIAILPAVLHLSGCVLAKVREISCVFFINFHYTFDRFPLMKWNEDRLSLFYQPCNIYKGTSSSCATIQPADVFICHWCRQQRQSQLAAEEVDNHPKKRNNKSLIWWKESKHRQKKHCLVDRCI